MGILDAAKMFVAEKSEKLSEMISELSETAKIKNEIREAQNMIDCLYMEIGKRCYEQRRDSSTEEDFRDFSIIDDKLKIIEELKKRLNRMDVCCKCGAPVGEEQRFCSQCGSPITKKKDFSNENKSNIDEQISEEIIEVDTVFVQNDEDEEFETDILEASSDISAYGEDMDPFESEGILNN